MKLDGYKLSPREVQVVEGLHQAKTNAEIGRDLGIKDVTVKVHLRSIMRKMGVRNRTLIVIRTLDD